MDRGTTSNVAVNMQPLVTLTMVRLERLRLSRIRSCYVVQVLRKFSQVQAVRSLRIIQGPIHMVMILRIRLG